MCRSAIVVSGVESGEYTPNLEMFYLLTLFEDLGFAHNERIALEDVASRCVRGDLQLLSCILFNAVHNALLHGQHGAPVTIRAHVEEAAGAADVTAVEGSCAACAAVHDRSAMLHVAVCNRPGANHEFLRAMSATDAITAAIPDLLAAAPSMAATLRHQGAGVEESTYLGLTEIDRAGACERSSSGAAHPDPACAVLPDPPHTVHHARPALACAP